MTTDTSSDAQARFDTVLANRSGNDRVLMACEMFDLARELMASRIKEEEPGLSDVDVHIRVFQRMYGDDIDAETMARVVRRMTSPAR